MLSCKCKAAIEWNETRAVEGGAVNPDYLLLSRVQMPFFDFFSAAREKQRSQCRLVRKSRGRSFSPR